MGKGKKCNLNILDPSSNIAYFSKQLTCMYSGIIHPGTLYDNNSFKQAFFGKFECISAVVIMTPWPK